MNVGAGLAVDACMKRITVVAGNDSISAQARTYAEYRIFALVARHTRWVRRYECSSAKQTGESLRQRDLHRKRGPGTIGLAEDPSHWAARVHGHQPGRRSTRDGVGTACRATALIVSGRDSQC